MFLPAGNLSIVSVYHMIILPGGKQLWTWATLCTVLMWPRSSVRGVTWFLPKLSWKTMNNGEERGWVPQDNYELEWLLRGKMWMIYSLTVPKIPGIKYLNFVRTPDKIEMLSEIFWLVSSMTYRGFYQRGISGVDPQQSPIAKDFRLSGVWSSVMGLSVGSN